MLILLLRRLLALWRADFIDVLEAAWTGVFILLRVHFGHAIHLLHRLVDLGCSFLSLLEELLFVIGIVVVFIFIKLRLILLITVPILAVSLQNFLLSLLQVFGVTDSCVLVLLRGRRIASLVRLLVTRPRTRTLAGILLLGNGSRALSDINACIIPLYMRRVLRHLSLVR